MKHEVDLSEYNLRTDLIIEKNNDLFTHNEIKDGNVTITITNLKKNNIIENKKRGTYITIEFNDITDTDNFNEVKKVFEKYLNILLKESKIKKKDTCLIVGLGNISSTADAIGPLTVKDIIVTNHIYLYDELDEKYRRVSAIAPNVTAVNGIETSDYIKGIVSILKPDFLIVIDSLLSKSMKRLNKTIQMTNTGITPGSGVGNNRKEIDSDSINIPIISVGIPTVVDVLSVVTDTIDFMEKHYAFYKNYLNSPISKIIPTGKVNYLNENIILNKNDNEKILGLIGTLSNIELRELLMEVLTPINYNMIVTPKEIDFLVNKLSTLLSSGINNTLHDIS